MANSPERKKRTCIVPICSGERFDLVHKFPCDNKRATQWKDLINNPILDDMSLDLIRKRYFVCSRHFKVKDYKNINSRGLNKTSLPSLNMNEFSDSENFNRFEGNIYHIDIKDQLVENDYKKINVEVVLPSLSLVYPHQTKKRKMEIHKEVNLIELPDTEIEIPVNNLSEVVEEENQLIEEHLKELNNSEIEMILPDSEDAQSPIEISNNPEKNVSMMQNFSEDVLEIQHDKYPAALQFHYFWLRDHCKCEKCYSADTFQRRGNFLDIPVDIKPINCRVEKDDLLVEWHDGHESTYNLDVLYKSQYNTFKTILKIQEPILWNKNQIQEFDYARINFNDYLSDDEMSKKLVRSLIKYGVAFIEKVPANQSSTEISIKRLFPIHKTLFGEMWTFSENKDHSDSAYTKEYLSAHTDNTYFNDASGLQVLHCIQHNGTGGDSLLLDGFKAIEDLKRKNILAFERLSTTSIQSEYIEEDKHHKHCAPIIQKNPISGCVEQIRFNMNDRAPLKTLPHNQIMQFYSDLRLLAGEIQNQDNEWWFKLKPGTVMIFDNWRILHGRAQYTGKRVMSGCYVSRTEFLSTARTMGIID